jgi:hypothetical protein
LGHLVLLGRQLGYLVSVLGVVRHFFPLVAVAVVRTISPLLLSLQRRMRYTAAS